jgi:hypothetical protein
MDFLHKPFDLGPSDVVEVMLDHPANVQLLDPANFERYRNRKTYHYFGGYVTESPFQLQGPHGGTWHLVIDLGGAAGQVRASAHVISTAPAA